MVLLFEFFVGFDQRIIFGYGFSEFGDGEGIFFKLGFLGQGQ